MVNHIHVVMASMLKIYDGIRRGVGTAISIIIKHHTHLRGINFNLPHAISIYHTYCVIGVEHVGGNMFEQIAPKDVVFIKMRTRLPIRPYLMNKNINNYLANGNVIIVDVVVERNEGSMRCLELL
eukprot:Gb_07724 [translate_table: standard]